ncbi:uncharacterized protein [Atheta coriaria]|uniref:uncharacterized protein n=1 Tax=Dalotia coriaria TaxID=877792 RepID=UPI0031F3C316
MMSPADALMQSLVTEFECPVCTQHMHPPIRQCMVGHSFCNECYKKLKTCPTCRQVLSFSSRSFVLEKLHAKLEFPCKYQEYGCMERYGGDHIESHEFQCRYGGNSCPLKIINDCGWHGRGKDIVGHCIKHHPNNIFCSNIQRLTCSNFVRDGQTSTASYYMVFFAFREVFKCVWEVNFITGFMRWCVFRVLTEEVNNGEVYDFIIDVQNQHEPGHKLAMKSVCPDLEQGQEEEFNNHQFVFTHYDMVKSFCKDNDLTYTIKIVQRIADFAISAD